ncbi:MAG TPA: hypothetical protein VIY53_19245 [Acidobacteriaceae bacterium]
MKRLLTFLGRVAMAAMIAAIVLYLADWVIFTVRAARGGGYGTVQVEQYLSTALKGNKQEYDYLGTVQVTCARALFPHGGAAPCWWQRRHTQQWE